MGQIRYRKAGLADIDLLTQMRLEELQEINQLSNEEDMTLVALESYRFYRKGIREDSYIAYIVYDENETVGSSGIRFYQDIPTVENPSGKKVKVTNLFLKKEYRGSEIASHLTKLLRGEAEIRGTYQLELCK